MGERRLLIVHFGNGSTPKILSLRSDGNGWIALGKCARKFAVGSSESWRALQDELRRCCGRIGGRSVCLRSLEEPTKTFECVRDIFDDPSVAVRVRATEESVTEYAAKDADGQVGAQPRHSRGNRHANEVRRAESGLARVRRLLSADVRPEERTQSRSTSSSPFDGSFVCSQKELSGRVGVSSISRARVTARCSREFDAVRRGNVRREEVVRDSSSVSKGSDGRRVSKPLSRRQMNDCLPLRRPGRTSGVPDPPTNVSVAGLFGQGVYVLWNPVWLDRDECNNGLQVLGYKVFLNGELEALAEGALTSHVVLYELKPGVEYEIFLRTRCHTVDSMPSQGVKYRMGFSATNACNKVQLLTLRSLTTMEVKESESYSTTYERCSQKATVSERSTSSSSSGIVTDDCPFVSPPPCKRRPSSVLFTPRDRVNTLPDPPTGACVTEEDGLLIVNWNPVSVQGCQSNNGHVVIGYKIYVNGKFKARARGAESKQSFILMSQLKDEDQPVSITVKTQGIVCDSVPSDECLYWQGQKGTLSPSNVLMSKSDSKDSFYSTDHSRHASESEDSISPSVFTPSNDESNVIHLYSSNRKHGVCHRPPITSSAAAKLSDLTNVYTACHQLVRPDVDRSIPCLETSV